MWYHALECLTKLNSLRMLIVKSISLEVQGLTLERVLKEAAGDEVVFLTTNGKIRFAVLPADESDEEVLAIRSNAELMQYLAECSERARTAPRKSMQQIRD